MTAVIDVHTHMYPKRWLELIRTAAAPRYSIRESLDSPITIYRGETPFAPLDPPHFDYEARIRNMSAAGVDVAILSLSCPSVFWGTPEVSAEAARAVNDEFAWAQREWPARIRWMASLPWEHPALAVEELERACANGAVGVQTLGNVNGRSLTEEAFQPVWRAIDARGLPVLIHPTTPPGVELMDLNRYTMVGSVGFMVDTSIAVVRMIHDGFFDEFPNVKVIAAHAGATLPYLVGRLDRVWETTRRARVKISRPPSEYLRRIYYDTVCYTPDALEMCIRVGTADNVMYGSDYPFNFGDMPGILARVDALAPDVRDRVRGANATRIFRL
jgi:aminocarboxymuconate-semialdehyde decarboxylase